MPADMDAILTDWDRMYELSLSREVTLKDRIFGETIHLVPQFNVARIYARDTRSASEPKKLSEALVTNWSYESRKGPPSFRAHTPNWRLNWLTVNGSKASFARPRRWRPWGH